MTSIQQIEETPVPGQAPSALEIQRKLSVAQRKGKTRAPIAQNSGTDTEDESMMANAPGEPQLAHSSQPLSAIAERPMSGAEESEEEDDDVAGGWRQGAEAQVVGASAGTGNVVLHSGYLWKKGSGRRKTWKKRWFVLRPTNLACYKTSAEYKLLRMLEISDIHAATSVQLKRHPNTCGIVTQARTFYFQAETATEIDQWVTKINEAKDALHSTSIPGTPVVIPPSAKVSDEISPKPTAPPPNPPAVSIVVPTGSPTVVFSEPISPISATASTSRAHPGRTSNTSSDSDDGNPSTSAPTSTVRGSRDISFSKDKDLKNKEQQTPGKAILSGYLMKCRTHRKIWRKRWFVLTPTKLLYMGSHMDAKPHREFLLNQILDAMEYRPSNRHVSPHRSQHELGVSPNESTLTQRGPASSQQSSNILSDDYTASGLNYTFKIITPKKTLLLSAPTEEEEVKWISAIRALIARRAKDPSAVHSKEKGEVDNAGSSSAPGNTLSGGDVAAIEERKRPVSKGAPPSSTGVPSGAGGAKVGATTTIVNA